MNCLNKVLTVDPGFQTGWAYWVGTMYPVTGGFSPPTAYKNDMVRLKLMASVFSALLYQYKPDRIIVEDQWFSEASLTSLTSAKTGSLKKLGWLLGTYFAACFEYGVTPELIIPMRWKGNMNDSAVRARVKLINGRDYTSSHVADAVGIGFNEMGCFIKVKEIQNG